MSFDLRILVWINNNLHGSIGFSYFVKYLTCLGEGGAIWIAACIIIVIFKKTRYAGLTLAVALILDYLIVNLVIKNIVNRPRPWAEYPDFESFYESISFSKPGESSFPSGHAAAAFCSAVVLLVRFKWKGLPALILAVVLALSRLYLCVHYPTDVLCGAIIGSLIGLFSCVIVSLVAKKIKDRKEIKNKGDCV